MERPDLTLLPLDAALYIVHLEGIIEGTYKVLGTQGKTKTLKQEEKATVEPAALPEPIVKKRSGNAFDEVSQEVKTKLNGKHAPAN